MSIRQSNTGQGFKHTMPERQTCPMRPAGVVGEEAAESSGGHPVCSKSFPPWSEDSPLDLQANSLEPPSF